jgi:hypothetical protein
MTSEDLNALPDPDMNGSDMPIPVPLPPYCQICGLELNREGHYLDGSPVAGPPMPDGIFALVGWHEFNTGLQG